MLFSRLPERKRPGTAVTLQSRATWDGWWTPGSIARLDLETTQCLRGKFVLNINIKHLAYLYELSKSQYLKASRYSCVSGFVYQSLVIKYISLSVSQDLKTSTMDKLYQVIFHKHSTVMSRV